MKRSELVKLTSEIPIGGSEDETKEAVKKLFRPTGDKYTKLSDEDINELDRLHDLEEAKHLF